MIKTGVLSLFLLYFRITRSYLGLRLYVLLALNLVSIVLESIGLLLFIPFFQSLGIGDSSSTAVSRWISSLLGGIGVETSVSAALILLVTAFVLKGAAVFFIVAYRSHVSSQVRADIREELVLKCANLDYRFAIGKSTGFFSNLIVSETDHAVGAMMSYCRFLISLATTIVFVATAVLVHPQLSVVILCAGVANIIMLKKVSGLTRHYSHMISALNSRLNGLLIELLQSFKYLKSTSQFDALQNLIRLSNRDAARLQLRQSLATAAYDAIKEPILVICICLIIYYYVVLSGQNIAVILVPILFFYRCMLEGGFAQSNWQQVCDDSATLENVYSASREFERCAEPVIASREIAFNNSLEFKGVGFSYGENPVLRDFSVLIPKYSSISFVGASGVGKTTIVDLITGSLKPQSGGVYVDGSELGRINLCMYRSKIGYVVQDTVIFSDTVANNISMQLGSQPNEKTLEEIRRIAILSNVDEFVRDMPQGYLSLVGERGIRLSGGQKQRLAIARELYKKPEILILDESTSALDSRSEHLIQQSIRNLLGKTTLILISHRLSTVSNVDQICVIQDGRVVEQGTFNQLLNSPGTRFRQMCEFQKVV